MWAPAALYNAMIAPLTPYTIRGVIWYQGESNSGYGRAPLYERLFPALIRDWRQQWGQGDFPFLFVQISSYQSTPAEDWPTIRDAQRKTLTLRSTAMAVTTDIGNPLDVHPTNKRDVGHRLALAARAVVYGESIEYSGPLFRQMTREEHALRVWFDHAEGLRAKSAGELTGFEIAGADGKFMPAAARIEGRSVVLSKQRSTPHRRCATVGPTPRSATSTMQPDCRPQRSSRSALRLTDILAHPGHPDQASCSKREAVAVKPANTSAGSSETGTD